MRTPSVLPANHSHNTLKLHLPVLDDDTAVVIYNFLCDLVDHFDNHYGVQICRFYAQQDNTHTSQPPSNNPDDPPF